MNRRSRSRGDMDVEAQAQSMASGSTTNSNSSPPTSLPTVREPTLRAIRSLSRVTNVLPVLSFADTWTDGQIGDVKRGVRNALAMKLVGFGVFDTDENGAGAGSTSGGAERNVDGGLRPGVEKVGARTLGTRRDPIPRLPHAIVNPDWDCEPYGDAEIEDTRDREREREREVENRRHVKDELICKFDSV